jgi:alcohol dehydrogenase (NADP+)
MFRWQTIPATFSETLCVSSLGNTDLAISTLVCAGLTAYSPLVRNGCGRGKKIGIVGLGGIGHFGLLFAKALGATVYVISRTHSKESDALKMGADGFIATSDKEWNVPHIMTFDMMLNTASSTEGFDLERYLSLLDVHGRWVSVGLPEGKGMEVRNQDLISNGCLIGASHLGSRREVLEMLDLAVKKRVVSWVEEVEISAEGLKTALVRLHGNDVRYRFTLTGYEKCFGA